MAYNLERSKLVEHLTIDAEYIPFEQIRSFKLLEEKSVGFTADVKKDYFSFFKDVKKECEYLLQTQPNNENCSLWREAIEEINKVIE